MCEEKRCAKCGETKPLDAFGLLSVVDKHGLRRRNCYCRTCRSALARETYRQAPDKARISAARYYRENREKEHVRSLRWRRQNLDKMRASYRRKYLKHHYGLTPEDYALLLKQQNGRCAFCREAPDPDNKHKQDRALHIDHDHETGEVRWLLCNACNLGLGKFKENIETLKRVIDCLEARNHAARRIA